jgi:ribosomal protein S8E
MNISQAHFISFFLFSGKYAQVTNNPENDGCINAVLLV